MDRRNGQILIFACLCLAFGGLARLGAQEPAISLAKPTPSVSGPAPGEAPWRPGGGMEKEAYRRLEQLPPDERDAFKRNLAVWHDLSPEEKMALRNLARARVHAEVDKAIQESGLRLDQDQREMFALRYTQERRKLERDLQSKAAQERARRMPEILARLKSEFTGGTVERPAGSPADASPSPGFMR